MIGTPMYGGVCTAHYMYSTINLTRLAAKHNVELNFQFTTSESLITRARSTIANTFFKSDYTHLIFIDSDIGFNAEDVFKLLSYNFDFVCGGYPGKSIDWSSIKSAALSGAPSQSLPNYASPFIYNRLPIQPEGLPKNIIEVMNAGTGFMMISKNVLEKLSNHVPEYLNNQFDNFGTKSKEFFTTMIKDDLLLSEDYTFCEKWRELGGKIFVDTSIKLKHVGSFVYEGSPNHYIS